MVPESAGKMSKTRKPDAQSLMYFTLDSEFLNISYLNSLESSQNRFPLPYLLQQGSCFRRKSTNHHRCRLRWNRAEWRHTSTYQGYPTFRSHRLQTPSLPSILLFSRQRSSTQQQRQQRPSAATVHTAVRCCFALSTDWQPLPHSTTIAYSRRIRRLPISDSKPKNTQKHWSSTEKKKTSNTSG
ncbi:unnamed protein product [Nesidiocoris tenuis]|uniref:Uncharacterized protein n=1 Tax=Nesidiocoris tenuis TaxID=355587 RepID=A0A6H5FV12_9HEMI|nr:unnamed protein product [Nesidiocoris tenuis]